MQVALYQPDMAANAAAVIRLAACMGVAVDIVEPCGFVWDDRRLRRVGMDYLAHAQVIRHPSWAAFERRRAEAGARLVLLTTRALDAHHQVRYRPGDILLGGRESAGVPEEVHRAADIEVRAPMAPGLRSLNLVSALAMVLGEGLRQTEGFAAGAPTL